MTHDTPLKPEVAAAVDRERHRVAMRFVSALFIVVFTVETTVLAWQGAWQIVPIGTLAACLYSAQFRSAKRGGA